MPCRVDICPRCNEYDCGGFSGGACKYGGHPPTKAQIVERDAQIALARGLKNFDHAGALCDVLSLIESKSAKLLKSVDPVTLEWWKGHSNAEKEKIREEALAKLTPREKRALGLK